MRRHSAGPARGSPPPGNLSTRPRVVVVDDSSVIQEYVGRLLAKEFTLAGAFLDGESFIDQWLGAAPDVIVLDVTLPGVSGLEAAAHLRRAGCEVPIVFCSVHQDDETVHAARAIGALGYVAKRDLGTDLVPALHAALAGRQFLSAVIELS
jgi:DNA-binding NarL/FixJ family response regulator